MNLENLTEEEKTLFTEYFQNHFTQELEVPQDNSEYLEIWNEIIEESKTKNLATLLNERIIPLRPCKFLSPEKIFIQIHEAAAGKIPLIIFENNIDFESFVTNLVYKGVPPENLSSTGASFVFGKKMRLIVLSKKPYSNVSAKTMGLDEDEWKELSMKIRLEHECTHFFTKTVFGVAKNHLHDELMADFFGIYNAFGEYKAEYFEYFMGIKGNEGSRLKVYIPDCSQNMYELLKQIASNFARFLEDWSKSSQFKSMTKEERIRYLCKMSDVLI